MTVEILNSFVSVSNPAIESNINVFIIFVQNILTNNIDSEPTNYFYF